MMGRKDWDQASLFYSFRRVMGLAVIFMPSPLRVWATLPTIACPPG